jgi:hypothetical protein
MTEFSFGMYGDIMKCECGMKRVMKHKRGETDEQLISRSLCTNCRRKGRWRIVEH